MSRKLSKYIQRNNEYLTYQTFAYHLFKLENIAMSKFDYEDLPSEIDKRFVEYTLLHHRKGVFFHDEILNKFLFLPFTDAGNYDVYHNPLKINAYADNGYHKTLDLSECVIMYENKTRTNIFNTLVLFANRLTELDRSIDLNLSAQKTPLAILCNEEERLSMENAYLKYRNGEPVIFGSKEFDKENFTVLNTEAPFVADKLENIKEKRVNEALTFIGVPSVGIEKKERLISDEINNANIDTEIMLNSRKMSRENAIRKINEKFGLNIKLVTSGDSTPITGAQTQADKGNFLIAPGSQIEKEDGD